MSVRPLPIRLCARTGRNASSGARAPVMVKMFLHAFASQMPSWFVSYFDSFISALADAISPEGFLVTL